MLIIMRIDREALAYGFFLRGPPQKNSWNKNPAHIVGINAAKIQDGTIKFTAGSGKQNYSFSLTAGRRVRHTFFDSAGQNDSRMLEPVWLLSNAERRTSK
jgi:hypothetical protein